MGVAQAAWTSPGDAGLCAATAGEGQVDVQPLRCASAAVTGHSADRTKKTRKTLARTSPPSTKKRLHCGGGKEEAAETEYMEGGLLIRSGGGHGLGE